MKLSLFFVLALTAAAGISPLRGTQPIKAIFDKADFVCQCRVSSITVSQGPLQNGVGSASVPKQARAVLQVLDAYKTNGQNVSSITLGYPVSDEFSISVRDQQTYLLFLTRTSAGTYEFADQFLGEMPFSSLPLQGGEPGFTKLESALVGTALQQNRDDAVTALQLLNGFDNLQSQSLDSLRSLANSSDPALSGWYVSILLKTKKPENLAAVNRFLDMVSSDSSQPAAIQFAILNVGNEIGEMSDPRARVDVEALTGSKIAAIKDGAMQAVRRMRDAQSAPVLVERLDDPNPDIQYEAVITLAEIFKKFDGDYAPGMGPFEKRPGYYTNLWKTWWTQNGHTP